MSKHKLLSQVHQFCEGRSPHLVCVPGCYQPHTPTNTFATLNCHDTRRREVSSSSHCVNRWPPTRGGRVSLSSPPLYVLLTSTESPHTHMGVISWPLSYSRHSHFAHCLPPTSNFSAVFESSITRMKPCTLPHQNKTHTHKSKQTNKPPVNNEQRGERHVLGLSLCFPTFSGVHTMIYFYGFLQKHSISVLVCWSQVGQSKAFGVNENQTYDDKRTAVTIRCRPPNKCI